MVREKSCMRSSESKIERRIDLPALLTTRSMPLGSRSSCWSSASTAVASDRSQGNTSARPPVAVRLPADVATGAARHAADPVRGQAFWPDPRTPAAELHALLRPYPAEAMEAVPVGRYVGNPRNEGPRCLAP